MTVEQVPWGEGKKQLTSSYRWLVARWARRMSWKETAHAFRPTWANVFCSVKHAVNWASRIEAICLDGIQWPNSRIYLTLVPQIDGTKRLLWVA